MCIFLWKLIFVPKLVWCRDGLSHRASSTQLKLSHYKYSSSTFVSSARLETSLTQLKLEGPVRWVRMSQFEPKKTVLSMKNSIFWGELICIFSNWAESMKFQVELSWQKSSWRIYSDSIRVESSWLDGLKHLYFSTLNKLSNNSLIIVITY